MNACVAKSGEEDQKYLRDFLFGADGKFHANIDWDQDGKINRDEMRQFVNDYIAYR